MSGTAVEIMGYSDNVLRAADRKHMDVPELLSALAPQQAPIGFWIRFLVRTGQWITPCGTPT